MVATRARPQNVVSPQPSEAKSLERLSAHIDLLLRQSRIAELIGPDGEGVEIPPSALDALMLVVRSLARGQAVTLIPEGRELTTQQAADLLHVSRPHLIKLLEQGVIAHHLVGTHRRIRIDDALEFRRHRSDDRRQKLGELTRLSEEAEGGYR